MENSGGARDLGIFFLLALIRYWTGPMAFGGIRKWTPPRKSGGIPRE